MEENKATTTTRWAPAAPLLTRRTSNPTIFQLIAESVTKPLSPMMTPSPAGSGELRSILHRLEVMEVESRDLLERLFSMVKTDSRLERYIRKRLQDPKTSRIWELIEQILASQQGKLDIQSMLNDEEGSSSSDGGGADGVCDEFGCLAVTVDKGVKRRDDGVRRERFKVRQFDMGEAVVAQPYYQTVKK